MSKQLSRYKLRKHWNFIREIRRDVINVYVCTIISLVEIEATIKKNTILLFAIGQFQIIAENEIKNSQNSEHCYSR